MQIDRFDTLPEETPLEFDLVIIGGGPCGLSIARELIGTGLRILVLESGLQSETGEHAALNVVGVPDGQLHETERAARTAYHSALPSAWNGDQQLFGVRCRGLGGSTLAWAGKSASFDDIDFETRSWVPHSGWPISRQSLDPYLDRAADMLNLGPNKYDEAFWQQIGQTPPEPAIDRDYFTCFFWQFARSRLNPMDTMRVGAEFAELDAPNVRLLLNATATGLHTDSSGTQFDRVDVSSICGKRHATVRARACVLAASAIENARLLLLSKDAHPSGLGNRNDLVGRFLTDHVQAPVARFDAAGAQIISHRFGFFGLRHRGRSHMYSHGLTLSKPRQRREQLLNSSVYFMEERSADDPVSALGRLVRRQSQSPRRDIVTVARSPAHLIKTVGLKALESDRMPQRIRNLVVETVVQRLPNMVAREYQFRGLPHKLEGAEAQCIVEQVPDRENRITLSDRKDALGLPHPLAIWRVGQAERHTVMQTAKLLQQTFTTSGLPSPQLPDWVTEQNPENGVLIDMGHTMGTTRMSETPTTGVVNPDQRLHDVHGVYLAGGSVMPTTGHANPTLMMVALSIRLSDHLKVHFGVR